MINGQKPKPGINCKYRDSKPHGVNARAKSIILGRSALPGKKYFGGFSKCNMWPCISKTVPQPETPLYLMNRIKTISDGKMPANRLTMKIGRRYKGGGLTSNLMC